MYGQQKKNYTLKIFCDLTIDNSPGFGENVPKHVAAFD